MHDICPMPVLEYATRCEKAHVLVKKKILFNLIRVFLVSLVEASASIFSCLSFSYFLDKPRFSEDEKKVFTVEEGGHLLINLTATANPPEIKYEWSKNGKDGRPIPEVADALPESRAIGKFISSVECAFDYFTTTVFTFSIAWRLPEHLSSSTRRRRDVQSESH